jgi:flagellar hook-associated protein 3 FlgL
MISSLSPQSQQFLADVAFAQQRIAVANQQLSSGLKIQAASDGPDVISELLQLRANLQKNSQLTNNLGLAKTDADVADASLSSATQLMDTALSLAAQGATETTTAAGRQAIAGQVQGILEQMVGYANTQSGGRYVFGGDAETSPPYQLDLSQANGVDQLTTAAATRRIEDPAGGSFPASQTAQQIFDNRNPDGSLANDNVFAALNTLRVALLNNDTGGITAATTSLKAASDHLNVSLAFYGIVENRIQDATTYAGNYNVQLQTQISQLQDADVAAASLEMTQGTTQLQAAFASEAQLPRYTLFDFLNTTAG